MKITVRPAMPDDAAAIARMNAEANDLRATVEHMAAHIALRSEFERAFIAEVDGQVAGYACLRLLPNVCDPIPYAELSELYVAAAFRREGVGSALIRHVEGVAASQGATALVLMTAWRNQRAHAFYHAMGYGLYTISMRRELG
jgi:ribosomal protein S18 acetylase RimI-like enzyme